MALPRFEPVTEPISIGVPRSAAETFYRGVDACVLELALSKLERASIGGAAAVDSLRPLLRDSAQLVPSEYSPDISQRTLPGHAYADICKQRIVEDRSGFTLFAPLLVQDPGRNIYARELHVRDTLLFAMYPSRPVFVLRTASSRVGAPLELHPFSADSARQDWRTNQATWDAWP